MTLSRAIKNLVQAHGGLRQAARALKIDVGYLQRLMTGEKNNPSVATLKKLRLTRRIEYFWNPSRRK